MDDLNQGAQQTSPSALEQAIASSPEVTEELAQQQGSQEAQTGTAKQPETPAPEAEAQPDSGTEPQQQENVPFNQHPRFKELIDENRWLKKMHEQTLQQRQQAQQFQQPEVDPYAGKTPEERLFYMEQDRRIREEAQKIVRNEMAKLSPVIDAGRMEIARIKAEQFHREHPDVKAGSPEEYDIVQRIQQYGYAPEDAYWSVMGPRGIRRAAETAKQQVKQQLTAKKQANVESSSGVSTQAQPAKKLSFREAMDLEMKKAGM